MTMYDNEIQLQEAIQRQIEAFAPSEGETLYRREVPMGARVPDFVCMTVYIKPESPVLPRNCSYRHASILWLLRRSWRLHGTTIARSLYSSTTRIQPAIEELVKAGAVVRHDTGSFSLSECWRSIRIDVLAIEAKLYRWSKALQQAESYQAFADRVVVAMDPLRMPRDPKVIQAFIDARVGLCAVSPEGTTWVVKPARLRTAGREQEYLFASALAPSSSQRLWSRLY